MLGIDAVHTPVVARKKLHDGRRLRICLRCGHENARAHTRNDRFSGAESSISFGATLDKSTIVHVWKSTSPEKP